MTDRVVPMHANTHRLVDALLPWYVNATLKPDERTLVERHLDECAQCRREVDWLRELHAACMACADEQGATQVFDTLPSRPQRWWRSAAMWRVAAVAQLAVVALLGWRLWAADDNDASYRTLGTSGALVTGNVVVVFDAATPEYEMRSVLQSVRARIVGGPTATNGYVLAIPAETQARALDALRAARSVKLAEPLGKP